MPSRDSPFREVPGSCRGADKFICRAVRFMLSGYNPVANDIYNRANGDGHKHVDLFVYSHWFNAHQRQQPSQKLMQIWHEYSITVIRQRNGLGRRKLPPGSREGVRCSVVKCDVASRKSAVLRREGVRRSVAERRSQSKRMQLTLNADHLFHLYSIMRSLLWKSL